MMLVVAAALQDGAGRYLMQRRPPHKAHGELWEFPGGKVEPGEAAVVALCRELHEELALRIDPDQLRPVTFAADDAVVLLLYEARADPHDIAPLAATALCWDHPAALAALPMPPLDIPLLAALRAIHRTVADADDGTVPCSPDARHRPK